MGKIGSFGTIAFSVSESTIKTFDKLTWKTSAKYATHDRHLLRDVQEYLGPEPSSITFKMIFSVFSGTNPLNEIKNLNALCESGITDYLVIGGKVYGSYKWVIQSVSNEMTKFDNQGNCWRATASVTMKEYPKR